MNANLYALFRGHFGERTEALGGHFALRSLPDLGTCVAAYCSTEVVGIQRPRAFVPLSASSGPLKASVG